MTDFSLQVTADELGKAIDDLAPHVERQIQDAVENVAHVAYSSIISQIQGSPMDPKNRQDMLRGMEFHKIGDSGYLISLSGDWAQKLEEGFSGYSIKDVLLASEKIVQVGSRSGQPWVRKSKKGDKYAVVPFFHKPSSKEAKHSDLAKAIKSLTAPNLEGIEQKVTQAFKDLDGRPIQGKAVTIKEVPNKPNLSGLTKYQHVYEDSGKVQSVYMTFRMVSENSDGWQHPGWRGHKFFQEAEDMVELELERIVRMFGE